MNTSLIINIIINKRMKKQSERLKEIRKSLKNISQGKLADLCDISLSTVQRIEHGTMEISDLTIDILKEKLNVNPVYLKTGKGEMFIDGIMPTINLTEKVTENPWKDALISELKEEVTYYRELLKIMAGGGQTAKLKAISVAQFAKYLPGKSSNSVRAVA